MSAQTQSVPAPYRLHGPSLWVGRLLYTLMILFYISMFGLSLSFKFLSGTAACKTIYNQWEFCADWTGAMNDWGLTTVAFESYFLILRLIVALPFFILSLILIWRHGHELRVLLFATLLPLIGIADNVYDPLWGWANGWFGLYSYDSLILLPRLLTYLFRCGMVVFVCLFPDGRFVPRWSRWLVGGWLLWTAVNVFFADWIIWPASLNILVGFIFIILDLTVVIIRYRQATAIQHQQIKWITFGLLLGLLDLLLDYYVWDIYPAVTDSDFIKTWRQLIIWELGKGTFSLISMFFVAICFGLAVFRHRLWDIDIIIRKTLQYSVVSTVLAIVYFSSITLIQGLVTAVTDTNSPLAIVLSTLLIAALFNPLRQRVQTFIDRRFYRQKYDAQQVLAQFARTARDEVDMEALQAELLRVVQETMQPEKVFIWLPKQNGQHVAEKQPTIGTG